MNARELLIPTDGLEQECAMCGYTWVAEEKHYKDCKVPALLAQFESMQKVCNGARRLTNLSKLNPPPQVMINEMELLGRNVAELDKTKGE